MTAYTKFLHASRDCNMLPLSSVIEILFYRASLKYRFYSSKAMNISCQLWVCCFLFSFCTCVRADISIDVLCLSTADAKPVNMEMRLYFDKEAKWRAGFVKYQNAKKPISIFLNRSVQEVISESAPYEHTDSWLEIVNGKTSGAYEITMQGAQIPSATYENYSKRKKFYFLLNSNVEGSPKTGCLWE